MATEIERKFLVEGEAWRDLAVGSEHLAQGYLSSNAKATVRVRMHGDTRAVVTIKGKIEGISRAEFEYDIPVADGREMLVLAEPDIVRKIRYRVPHGGLVWEVDVFEGAHAGLVMAEVELKAADQAIVLPDWAGQEVSYDDRYANATLARNPGVPAVDSDVA